MSKLTHLILMWYLEQIGGGTWRSDDGGSSWHEKIIGAPNTVATQVVVTPNGDVYVAIWTTAFA